MSVSTFQVRICDEHDQQRWETFVDLHKDCTSYHRWPWQHVFHDVFGWKAIYLMAERNGEVCGILPLIWQKCWWHSYLSSMPHLQGGGIVANSDAIAHALVDSAIEMTQTLNASYLELRHATPHDLPLLKRQDKVAAWLAVEPDVDQRLRQLDKKTRNLVRKSLSFGMTVEFGREELLENFYDVYRRNMHDLGSPCYSRAFFSHILRCFPAHAHLCVVRQAEQSVAAAFLLGFRTTLEVAWASALRKFLSMKPNMFLYWNILAFAAERGYQILDFGRSSRDSGSYAFKLQWGAIPQELPWSYWLNGAMSAPATHSSGMQLASRLWQLMPDRLTDLLGPTLVEHIPGI